MDFGRIYEEYFRELQRYLLSLCRDSRIAEELTQETFFRAVRSAGPGIWADGELGAGDLLSGQAEDHRGIGGGEAWRIDPWAAG